MHDLLDLGSGIRQIARHLGWSHNTASSFVGETARGRQDESIEGAVPGMRGDGEIAAPPPRTATMASDQVPEKLHSKSVLSVAPS
jgi:hypothetical protein